MSNTSENIFDILRTAHVQSFYVEDIYETGGARIVFSFKLTTDVGTFTAKNIRFGYTDQLDELIVAFRPGFGDVLKQCVLNMVDHPYVDEDSDSDVTYQK